MHFIPELKQFGRRHKGTAERRGLRICHLGKYYPPASGGIETHTQTLARAQAVLGAHVSVVVVNHTDGRGHDVTFTRLARTRNAVDYDEAICINRVGRLACVGRLDLVPRLPRLLGELLRDPPDVWHLHAPNPTMMLSILLFPRLRPLVITHHSDIVRQRVLKRFVRPLERNIYRRASRILATSPVYVFGSELLREFEDKLEALPLGLDLTPFSDPSPAAIAHAAALKRRYTGPIWVSVGRLVYYKGLHLALDALRLVPGTLLVIGTGPMEAEWKRQAEQLGVANRVIWFGAATADELVGAYRAATALWFPSTARSEGFGLVQVEAMARGLPVINTRVPNSGVAWACRNEREGLTVPVNDSPAFAAAAMRLIKEPGLHKRLAAAGPTRAAAEFDWLRMAERSFEIYRSLESVSRVAPHA